MSYETKNLLSCLILQKFHNNEKLAAVIAETHARYNKEISEDDLISINAAGDVNLRFRSPFTTEGKDDD